MKKIENLDLTVTYKVDFGDIEVSDEIYAQLTELQDDGSTDWGDILDKYPDLAEFIKNNVDEDGASSIEYDVWDMY